jgi:putative transferase (TIGR04331 family)
LIVRLYPQDFGWDQAARWRDRFPDLQVNSGESNIDDLVRRSRLYISTYNATTFLESFTRNVPSVIFWNPDHWELRESAEPYFADLRRVGIFHETAESAAHHVTDIWDDIDAWWQSARVREALDRFKERYCHLPVDLAGCVTEAIRGVMTAGDEAFSP